jgi:transposase
VQCEFGDALARCSTTRRNKGVEEKRLIHLLLQGPLAHGYRTNLWTTLRIAEVMKCEFGVRYHRAHVGRLMHSLKWSPQKPERRALERDEEKIKRWKRNAWPRVKKTLRGWAPI